MGLELVELRDLLEEKFLRFEMGKVGCQYMMNRSNSDQNRSHSFE